MKIAVLLGGDSPEREVSQRSGKGIGRALAGRGHTVTLLDPAARGFARKLAALRPDCVFIALHGGGGEGGVVQGYLETLGIPYTGSDPESSAICLNKLATKKLLRFHGLPTPDFLEVDDRAPRRSPFGFPVVVKPARLGSTIGISIVRKAAGLAAAVRKARRLDRSVFLERFIRGTEITIGLLGNERPRVLPAIEIGTPTGFYDYHAKYAPGGSVHTIPARLPAPTLRRAGTIAADAFRILGCSGLARMEIIVDRRGTPWVLDVNTIPGFTATSLYPEAAAAAGIPFGELCERLVRLGISRWRRNHHRSG